MLLISRYREELHVYQRRSDAMIRAWKESASAIFASGASVIIGVLCLGFSELNSNKSLGPVAAIGIACTLLVMMTFLPVALAVAGRWVFWPRRPTTATPAAEPGTAGIWGRIARFIGAHHRATWIGASALLLICLLGLPSLKTDGLSTAQGFTNTPDAVVGQQLYDAKFPQGVGAPAVITTNTAAVEQGITAASAVPGVANSPGSVCVQIDYTKIAALGAPAGGSGSPAPTSRSRCSRSCSSSPWASTTTSS